jgi:hypothetical protein
MRLRRAVSSISSGLAPVGYLNRFAIKAENLLPGMSRKRFSTYARVIGRPFLFGGAHADAPLPSVVVVMVAMRAVRIHCGGV